MLIMESDVNSERLAKIVQMSNNLKGDEKQFALGRRDSVLTRSGFIMKPYKQELGG